MSCAWCCRSAFRFVYGWVYSGMLLVWFVLAAVIPAVIITLTARTARELILVLQLTSFAALGYGVLLGVGIRLLTAVAAEQQRAELAALRRRATPRTRRLQRG